VTKRFFIPATGGDVEALKVAIYGASFLAEEHNSELTIVAQTLKNVPSTILNQIINQDTIKKMTKGATITFNNVPMRIVSSQTFNPHKDNGVIVALWGENHMLNKIDESTSAVGVFGLRWIEGDMDKWANKHNANQLPFKVNV